MSNPGEIYLVIHGHFYQPPRENPWLGLIDLQESAAPFHDWNERILSECYRPNTRSRLFDSEGRIRDVVNNLENISYNFGPTLIRYIEAEDPETYRGILDADRRSAERYSGHGNAIAQSYHHVILPLALPEDRKLMIRWGLADFEERFGRKAEGLWCPETAIHSDTALDLIEARLRFVLLSPHQAEKVRPLGKGGKWIDVSNGSVDTRRAYRIFPVKGNRDLSIDVFFYDANLSVGISFEHMLRDANVLGDRLREAAGEPTFSPRLVHVSTDGEVYGHHEPFADMCLAALFDGVAEERGLRVTNPGEFLDIAPPEFEAVLKSGPRGEGTAWSCAHGVGRWTRDCGCSISNDEEWDQKWRTPLRKSLNTLRNDLGLLYEKKAPDFFTDPGRALDNYVGVLIAREREAWKRFLSEEGTPAVLASPDASEEAYNLIEMAHGLRRMFTSCGWFFDDIAGIEAVQNLLFAGHTIDLARRIDQKSAESAEKSFQKKLRAARSNVEDEGDGQSIFRERVEDVRVSLEEWVAAWATTRFTEGEMPPRFLIGRPIELLDETSGDSGSLHLLSGRIKVREDIGACERELFYVAARDKTYRFCVWVGENDADAEPVRNARTLEDVENGANGKTFRLLDLPMELRRCPADRIVRSEMQNLLDVESPFFKHLDNIIDLLGRMGIGCPSELRPMAAFHMEKLLDTVVTRFFEAVESEEDFETIQEDANDVRALAEQRGMPPDLSSLNGELRSRALRLLIKRREGDGEQWAEKTLTLLEEAARIGLSPEPFGHLQDEMLDQIRGGIETGPKARELVLHLGYALEILYPDPVIP